MPDAARGSLFGDPPLWPRLRAWVEAHAVEQRRESPLAFARDYRAELERRIRAHMDEADASDDEGAHVGFARHHRALAAGLNEAVQALDAAWREREEPRA